MDVAESLPAWDNDSYLREKPPISSDVEAQFIGAAEDARVYFGERLAVAMRSVGVESARPTEHYLTDLLCGFTVSTETPGLFVPLAELLHAASTSEGPHRRARMRQLADVSLFLSGFFHDSFDRRGLTQAYVTRMGGTAYSWLGEVAQGGGEASHALVFGELASRFRQFARVLDEVREQTSMCTDGAIVRLYERWLCTGSAEVERRLRRRGVTPERRLPAKGQLN